MTTIEQDINELLARLSACTAYVEYAPLRSRCVQALDSYEYGVGVGPNRAGQWTRFERIDAEKRAMFAAMSVDELCAPRVNLLDAVNQANALAQLDRATDAFCMMLASRSLPALREADAMEAAE